MRKNYNNTRAKLHLPEYGRHIQEMVNALISIENRDERNKQAKAVIAVMGNINPLLRDTASFTHKLWDHLFIMSDFQLDVDSPYEKPSRDELMVSPKKLKYPQERIAYKHYGKNVSKAIKSLSKSNDPKAVEQVVDNIAKYMRSKSYEYNQEHPSNQVIIKDIKIMSTGDISLNEDAINNIRSDYKQHPTGYSQKGQQRNGQRKNRNPHNPHNGRTFQKNNSHRRNLPK